MRRPSILMLVFVVGVPHLGAAQLLVPHTRQARLPPMITTRSAVEALAKELIGVATSTEAEDTVIKGNPMVSMLAQTMDGRGVGFTTTTSDGLDSVRRYLGATSALSRFQLSVNDARVYRYRAGLLEQPRVSEVSLTLLALPQTTGNGYRVVGEDLALVNRIADRIEAFGKASATWRSPRAGDMIKTAMRVLALLLIPIALAFRDRRQIWLLYPVSAVLLAVSSLFPFAELFNNLVITGTR